MMMKMMMMNFALVTGMMITMIVMIVMMSTMIVIMTIEMMMMTMQVSVCDTEFCPGSEYILVVHFEANPLPTQVSIMVKMVKIIKRMMMNMMMMAYRHIPTMTNSHHGGFFSVMIMVGICQ